MKFLDDHITKNFRLAEIQCGTGEILLNEKVVAHAQRLQRFRDWYKRPIIVNSWYRTAEYNAKVGGVPKSQHIQGIATDCALPKEFFEYTKERQNEFLEHVKQFWVMTRTDGNMGGVGFYDTFFHLDSRSGKELAFWDNRSK
jgi:uncharacterized protein YcbK (DUF882 family)